MIDEVTFTKSLFYFLGIFIKQLVLPLLNERVIGVIGSENLWEDSEMGFVLLDQIQCAEKEGEEPMVFCSLE